MQAERPDLHKRRGAPSRVGAWRYSFGGLNNGYFGFYGD
jgi:hypothetical protein